MKRYYLKFRWEDEYKRVTKEQFGDTLGEVIQGGKEKINTTDAFRSLTIAGKAVDDDNPNYIILLDKLSEYSKSKLPMNEFLEKCHEIACEYERICKEELAAGACTNETSISQDLNITGSPPPKT